MSLSPRRRRAVLACIGSAAALAVAATAMAGVARRTRVLHLPPAPGGPRTISVDEYEYRLVPSRLAVGAGPVRVTVANRGMDDHDLVMVGPDGVVHRVDVPPGAAAVMTPALVRGTYRVFCSLFAGTPESHEALGMRFDLRVR